jgi:hypothetical protein
MHFSSRSWTRISWQKNVRSVLVLGGRYRHLTGPAGVGLYRIRPNSLIHTCNLVFFSRSFLRSSDQDLSAWIIIRYVRRDRFASTSPEHVCPAVRSLLGPHPRKFNYCQHNVAINKQPLSIHRYIVSKTGPLLFHQVHNKLVNTRDLIVFILIILFRNVLHVLFIYQNIYTRICRPCTDVYVAVIVPHGCSMHMHTPKDKLRQDWINTVSWLIMRFQHNLFEASGRLYKLA